MQAPLRGAGRQRRDGRDSYHFSAISGKALRFRAVEPLPVPVLWGSDWSRCWAAGYSSSPRYREVPFTNVQKNIGPNDERVFFSKIPMTIPTKNIINTFGIALTPKKKTLKMCGNAHTIDVIITPHDIRERGLPTALSKARIR